ncbi:Triosephosphate isomerase [Methylophaga frappieri]|uniref:Triosephosphate isomerase n=1 Tax=Methylophaga frappieri (strain ATCC BAA-2434 / DSM 25690 / JAM7) TaxID=754477 RepID=I1YHH2_METFJ|nr:triose-phosphate isomerase [Methylophaga frappieri]AFJ02365.1 Triosephosphate isomerase [Methylophaga frappieri]
MRKPLIAGNWKMIGTRATNQALLEAILDQRYLFKGVDVALFPPAVYLQQVQTALQGTELHWGTQNLSQFESGAYTGEISAAMCRDFGSKYVLMGHSERRCLYAELNLDQHFLDHIIAEKYEMALRFGLTPIVCIGESPEEHALGQTEEVVIRLLDTIIAHQGADSLQHAVLAYEPVWAIGTGKTATPEWAQEVHSVMRKRIASHNPEVARNVQILYGGSVKGNNAGPLFAKPDVDGGLIGGSSRDADDFVKICQAARQS